MQIEGQIERLQCVQCCAHLEPFLSCCCFPAFRPLPGRDSCCCRGLATTPLPLGKKTQRFRELLLLQNTHFWTMHTIVKQHRVHDANQGSYRHIYFYKEIDTCANSSTLASVWISVALNILKAMPRIIYDKARKNPDFLLFRGMIEMLTFLKFHSVNFWLGIFSTLLERLLQNRVKVEARFEETKSGREDRMVGFFQDGFFIMNFVTYSKILTAVS